MERTEDGAGETDREFQESDETRARVAWYYFVGGLTQQEIARKFDITRRRVNRIVGQLRAEGSVRTEIKLALVDCIELEDRLQKFYDLQSVRVVPSLDDEREQQRVIGEAAGEVLDSLLEDGAGLGVGWGRTLAAALPCISPRHYTKSWVATLMGGMTQGLGTTTFELATAFAKALGSECYYLAVPIYLPTASSRLLLEGHYGIAEVLARIKNADIAFVSCGDLSKRSQLVGTQVVAEHLATLKAAGAVGDLLGLFIDENGQPVDHPLNQRLMALQPESLRQVPKSILASGGVHKMLIVRAVLRAGYVKHLVTDERCAELLLRQGG
jgi:DNA-binding transcriptional regulator LsrR (DeoR family)